MEKEFQTLFRDPPAPFWAWNCKLDRETMVRQVLYFKEMGMGGFHMHCRTGLDTEYLGEEFMRSSGPVWKRPRRRTCWPGSTMRTAGPPALGAAM